MLYNPVCAVRYSDQLLEHSLFERVQFVWLANPDALAWTVDLEQ